MKFKNMAKKEINVINEEQEELRNKVNATLQKDINQRNKKINNFKNKINAVKRNLTIIEDQKNQREQILKQKALNEQNKQKQEQETNAQQFRQRVKNVIVEVVNTERNVSDLKRDMIKKLKNDTLSDIDNQRKKDEENLLVMKKHIRDAEKKFGKEIHQITQNIENIRENAAEKEHKILRNFTKKIDNAKRREETKEENRIKVEFMDRRQAREKLINKEKTKIGNFIKKAANRTFTEDKEIFGRLENAKQNFTERVEGFLKNSNNTIFDEEILLRGLPRRRNLRRV